MIAPRPLPIIEQFTGEPASERMRLLHDLVMLNLRLSHDAAQHCVVQALRVYVEQHANEEASPPDAGSS